MRFNTEIFPPREIINHFREVFSTNAGLEVLNYLHLELGTFEPISNSPEDVALKNYGNRLMAILGGGKLGVDSVDTFMKNLMKQALPKEEDGTEND